MEETLIFIGKMLLCPLALIVSYYVGSALGKWFSSLKTKCFLVHDIDYDNIETHEFFRGTNQWVNGQEIQKKYKYKTCKCSRCGETIEFD